MAVSSSESRRFATSGSRDPAPPFLRAAQARLRSAHSAHVPSHENRQFLTRGPNGPQRGATTVQFTASASQNSSPDSCPGVRVHAGMLSAFSL